MKKIAVFDKNLKETKKIELNDNVFDIKSNDTLIHQVAVGLNSNLRRSTAHTKTRGEISGGGKKPWKQKGTGRARAGSSRSPIWVGGGIVFGPRNIINWQKKINKKMKQKAFCMLLTNKVDNDLVLVIDKLEFDNLKTKIALEFFKKANLIDDKRVLICLDKKDENIEKAINNVKNIKIKYNLNVLDLLKYKKLVVTEAFLNRINELYGKLNFKNKEK